MPEAMDLNADLGEGFGRWDLTDDQALLDVVTSANVACGAHAGDPTIMRRVCQQAVERGVRIGAHVAYRDLAGFGRRAMDMPVEALADEMTFQIGALQAFAAAAGGRVSYVKPHGALYNRIVRDEIQAAAVVAGIKAAAPGLPILGLPGSAVLRIATESGLPAVPEAFADRAYAPDGSLVPRDQHGAVIAEQQAVVERALALCRDRHVTAIDGSTVPVRARSLCLHGDTPGAAAHAARVRAALEDGGVEVAAFA